MSQMTRLYALFDEIRQLRRENYELRRQVELTRGLQTHEPYSSHSPNTSAVLPRLGADLPMLPAVTGSVRPRTPPHDRDLVNTSSVTSSCPDPKRVRSMVVNPSGVNSDSLVLAAEDIGEDEPM